MKALLLIIFLTFTGLLHAQAQNVYLVTFKDKGPNTEQRVNHPETVLSPKSLVRRQRLAIPVSVADLPVYKNYLLQLKKYGSVSGASKWLNAALVNSALSATALKQAMPAIANVQFLGSQSKTNATTNTATQKHQPETTQTIDYGASYDQIRQLNLNCLHDKGFTGSGVTIAHFDSGWPGVDTLAAYNHIRNQNRFLATRNFVAPGNSVYSTHLHGSLTLSVIAANLPGTIVGGAPDANFILALTEDAPNERHQEEINWAMAAEWADSIGTDVISSSLGYKTGFDPGEGDYTSADMDGNTTIVTRAADHAASLGILVVNSAGNDGQNGITAPCDGDSVLCIGAIDINENIAGFSSVGPTADGRIKPDIVARGVDTKSVYPDGNIGGVSGTSLSCPLAASLAACLRQAYPTLSNVAIYNAIRRSSNRYNNPDNTYGYGLPDACKADSILALLTSTPQMQAQTKAKLFPNPAAGSCTLAIEGQQSALVTRVEIYTALGQLLQTISWPSGAHSLALPVQKMQHGAYFISILQVNGTHQMLPLLVH